MTLLQSYQVGIVGRVWHSAGHGGAFRPRCAQIPTSVPCRPARSSFGITVIRGEGALESIEEESGPRGCV
jgi:hypothetical protein